MADLWHSWGTSPKQKAREKEYNHWYYEKNKNKILSNRANSRDFDYGDRGNMDTAGANIYDYRVFKGIENSYKQLNSAYDRASFNGSLGRNRSSEYSKELASNQQKNQFPAQRTSKSLQEQKREKFNDIKAEIEDVVENLGDYLLKSNVFAGAAALGATLIRNRAKAAGLW